MDGWRSSPVRAAAWADSTRWRWRRAAQPWWSTISAPRSMAAAALRQLEPEVVTPGLIALVADDAPTRTILCAGAGAFERAHVTLTQGIHVGHPADAAEQIAAHWDAISDREGETIPESGGAQGMLEIGKAMLAHGQVP